MQIFPHLIKSSLQGRILHMGTTIQIMEGHATNTQTSHSAEAMRIYLEIGLSTTRMEIHETTETFLVLHRLKKETSHKITPIEPKID